MNKALEVIEAKYLFRENPDKIEAIIHPEGLIHSLVEFCDGTILASMALPDMKIPISYGLGFPDIIENGLNKINLQKLKNLNINIFPLSLLFIQPIFMASNLVVARGGVEFVPPISLAFWRWTLVFLILLPFTYVSLKKNFKIIKKEYKKLFFLGSMGCGVCGAFPFLAGETTTVTNMGIIYTSSPVFIILISYFFFNERINFTKIIGLIECLIGVFTIIVKGNLEFLINLEFTIGDLWMLAAAIGWALYLSLIHI